jgi:hypothetical protein
MVTATTNKSNRKSIRPEKDHGLSLWRPAAFVLSGERFLLDRLAQIWLCRVDEDCA